MVSGAQSSVPPLTGAASALPTLRPAASNAVVAVTPTALATQRAAEVEINNWDSSEASGALLAGAPQPAESSAP